MSEDNNSSGSSNCHLKVTVILTQQKKRLHFILHVVHYLQLVLQGSSGALPTVLVHDHNHVCKRVHLYLLHLQIILQHLRT